MKNDVKSGGEKGNEIMDELLMKGDDEYEKEEFLRDISAQVNELYLPALFLSLA